MSKVKAPPRSLIVTYQGDAVFKLRGSSSEEDWQFKLMLGYRLSSKGAGDTGSAELADIYISCKSKIEQRIENLHVYREADGWLSAKGEPVHKNPMALLPKKVRKALFTLNPTYQYIPGALPYLDHRAFKFTKRVKP